MNNSKNFHYTSFKHKFLLNKNLWNKLQTVFCVLSIFLACINYIRDVHLDKLMYILIGLCFYADYVNYKFEGRKTASILRLIVFVIIEFLAISSFFN